MLADLADFMPKMPLELQGVPSSEQTGSALLDYHWIPEHHTINQVQKQRAQETLTSKESSRKNTSEYSNGEDEAVEQKGLSVLSAQAPTASSTSSYSRKSFRAAPHLLPTLHVITTS